jgi:hypothetical protein
MPALFKSRVNLRRKVYSDKLVWLISFESFLLSDIIQDQIYYGLSSPFSGLFDYDYVISQFLCQLLSWTFREYCGDHEIYSNAFSATLPGFYDKGFAVMA